AYHFKPPFMSSISRSNWRRIEIDQLIEGRFWLIVDIRRCAANVRFWGKSGHCLLQCICLLLTQTGDRLDVSTTCRRYVDYKGYHAKILPQWAEDLLIARTRAEDT